MKRDDTSKRGLMSEFVAVLIVFIFPAVGFNVHALLVAVLRQSLSSSMMSCHYDH